MSNMMRALVKAKAEPGIWMEEVPVPEVGPNDVLIKVGKSAICGTDVHIMKGEYPVRRGLIVGHEPVGVIEKLGSAVQGYREGQRVIAGAITPSGHSAACLCGCLSQDGAGTKHGFKAIGGWKFGNTIDGCQAEYVRVPHAMANLTPVPDELTDEQVLMCPDIMSTGFGGAESGGIRIGDTVAVFAQGPIGLCATAGAKLMGASRIIAVDGIRELDRSIWEVTMANVLPLRTIGTASTRMAISVVQLVSPERSMTCDSRAASTRGFRSARIRSPTKSLWKTVCVVDGRTCAKAT